MSAATLDDLRNARRIMCAGVTGSGKSTLAAELAQQLGLPLVLIDDLCWEPGWIQPERAELDARVLPVLDRPAYVIDSVYGIHAAQALERVDVVVALDYPRATSLLRLLRRTARTRELICNGNVETLSRAFARDSIIASHIHAWANKRARMRGWHADPTAPPVLLLRRPRDADALLADLARAGYSTIAVPFCAAVGAAAIPSRPEPRLNATPTRLLRGSSQFRIA